MKILIAYYSRTGNTEKLAEVLKKELETRGNSVEIEKVKPKKEHSFLGWFFLQMVKGECDIEEPKIKDVSKYDLILIGSPNWTRLSLPVTRYLQEIKGLQYKNIGFFSTTTWPPILEWYFLSAYLLDISFSRIITKKKGRIIDFLFLSSLFKKWGFVSEYGRKKIKSFCDKITTPLPSIKIYFLERKEKEGLRFFAVIFSSLFILFLILRFVLSFFGISFLIQKQHSLLAFIFLVTFLILTFLKEKKRGIFLGKYLGGFSLALCWTLPWFFLEPHLDLGRLLLWGYLFIFILVSFLREQKLVLFTGLTSILGYFSLFFSSPQKEFFKPILDLPLLFFTMAMVSFITKSLQKDFLNSLEVQDEIEMAKSVLEIKVRARTRELRELVESLDVQIKERTRELQEKIEELERFQRLAVGRELKMIELKEEIKRLKEELEKIKKKS